MRLVAYFRVSSVGQQRNGFGIPEQRQQARAWAKANGHRIVHEVEEAMTGTADADDRPGLTEALQMLRDQPSAPRKADGLLVAKVDRLARALTVQEAALALASKMGSRVFAAEQIAAMQSGEVDAEGAILHAAVHA